MLRQLSSRPGCAYDRKGSFWNTRKNTDPMLTATYTLHIAFTDAQLQRLYATGANVIIAKPGPGSPYVSWQVFSPLRNNTLSWQEAYGIYIADAPICDGAGLVPVAGVPSGAVMDRLYTLDKKGNISGPGTDGLPGAFALLNNWRRGRGCLTTGLFQNALVNGREVTGNAVSAVPVLFQNTAVIRPAPTLRLWLQSGVVSNMVITQVESPVTTLTFGESRERLTVAYDADAGVFIPAATGDYAAAVPIPELGMVW